MKHITTEKWRNNHKYDSFIVALTPWIYIAVEVKDSALSFSLIFDLNSQKHFYTNRE